MSWKQRLSVTIYGSTVALMRRPASESPLHHTSSDFSLSFTRSYTSNTIRHFYYTYTPVGPYCRTINLNIANCMKPHAFDAFHMASKTRAKKATCSCFVYGKYCHSFHSFIPLGFTIIVIPKVVTFFYFLSF